jgi:phosphatidate cytidylyltransferase
MYLESSNAELGFAGVLAALLATMWVVGRTVRKQGSPVSSGRARVLGLLYVALFATFTAPAEVCLVVFGLIGAAAASEILRAFGIGRSGFTGVAAHTVAVLAGLAAPWALARADHGIAAVGAAALGLVIVILAIGLVGARSPARGWAWIVVLCALAALNAFSALRTLPEGGRLCLYLFFLVNAADTAAFFCGKLFGRHALVPAISPRKTVEGSVGSIAVTLGLGFVFARVLELPLSAAEVLMSSVAINVLAQAGDLIASLLKRRLGLKDYGSLLRGHGGVLDRFDSCLIAAPAFLVWFGSIR